MMYAGIGYDVHRFVENRKLILGGVCFDHPLGLSGHSDADVVLHAVGDAILGAASLGDIGELFPDTDDKWKGISSQILLDKIIELVNEKGLHVNNVDIIYIAQEPKISKKKKEMEQRISEILKVDMETRECESNYNRRTRLYWKIRRCGCTGDSHINSRNK